VFRRRIQVLATKKNQITKHKYQTNNKDRNSKFQTDHPPAFVPNGIITGGQKFGQRYGTTALNVLVIGYCNLEFICHLVLVICYFWFIAVRQFQFKF
jgi:hypothetical protein